MSRQSVSNSILQLLETHHVLTAPDLVEKLHHQGHPVNKTSVYRALDKLLEKGVLCRQNLQDNELVYELRAHHHDHLVCENCGKVQPIDCVLENPPMKEGFTIDHHHVTLYGRCSDCQP